MVTKGYIDDNMKGSSLIKLLKEVIEKAKQDSLNIKEEEYDFALRALDRLNTLVPKAENWDFIKGSLTARQLLKLVEKDE